MTDERNDIMELWDAYDADFNKIDGVTLVRSKPIPKGMRHLVCDVIVRHADGEYLLMQRDKRKHYGVKILGDGELSKSLTVKAAKFSKSAQAKIEANGGKAEVI